MTSRSVRNQASVRYPLRRHRQQVDVLRAARPAAVRPVPVRMVRKQASWGARMMIAFLGWVCGVAADALVMFANDHFQLAKNRDPELYAIVLGTGFAGHAIYLAYAALAITLLTAFDRQRWILWLLLGFLGGLISI